MDQRQQVALAYGITMWATTYEHIKSMQTVGSHVPYGIAGDVRAELRMLCLQWPSEWGTDLSRPEQQERVIEAARAYVTEHIEEIDRMVDQDRE